MRTVTLHYPNPANLKAAEFRALMHGVTVDDADSADGYLDVIVPANEAGVRQFVRIQSGGTIVSVLDEPLDLGPDRTETLTEKIRTIIGTLPNGVRRK